MSWLVIDAGNSAVKWAISDREGHRFMGTGLESNGALEALDMRLMTAWGGLRFRGVYATSVADAEVNAAIESAVRACCGREVTWFGSQRHFEGRGLGHGVALLNGYRDPFQLGADRWHALVAACAKFPDQPLVVVSAGTATTVDCVRAEPYAAAIFLGGVIAPGFGLMRESLSRGTARLPLVEDSEAPSPHATRTEQAIVAGVHYAQLGLVENVVREFAASVVTLGAGGARGGGAVARAPSRPARHRAARARRTDSRSQRGGGCCRRCGCGRCTPAGGVRRGSHSHDGRPDAQPADAARSGDCAVAGPRARD